MNPVSVGQDTMLSTLS